MDKCTQSDDYLVLRLAQIAQDTMESYAFSCDLQRWHETCEAIFGTAYPSRIKPPAQQQDLTEKCKEL